ncbi:MAG: DNA-binding protein WhiA [Firmicutes bacterium]|nr:DNA-binding protein WhiA [Bacillota bacterium]
MAKWIPDRDCCRESLLASMLFFGGDFKEAEGYPRISTCNHRISRILYKLLKYFSGENILWEVSQEKFLQKRKQFNVMVPMNEPMKKFLESWGLPGEIKKNRLRKSCCKRAFLLGAFLIKGSINTPSKYYHLEIISPDETLTGILHKILQQMEISAGVTIRKNDQVIYIKKADDIANFLTIMGAHGCLLKFEEIRAIKETREEVRRRVNCETANSDKTIQAAVRQALSIASLQEKGLLEKLPRSLREIADLRIRFPQASLKELGERLNPPISKSSVNSRLRRLESMAEPPDDEQQGLLTGK